MKSYFDAEIALREFRRMVYEICDRVLKSHMKEYGDALGVDLSSSFLEHWDTPEKNWDGTFAVVGIKQSSPLTPAKLPACKATYFGLWWEQESDGSVWFGPTAAMGFGKIKDSAESFSIFTKMEIPKGYFPAKSDYDVWLSTDISPLNVEHFEKQLDDLFCTWIQLWKRVADVSSAPPSTPDISSAS